RRVARLIVATALFVVVFALQSSVARADVTFVSNATGLTPSTGPQNSMTWTHSVSGSQTFLLIGITVRNPSGNVPAIQSVTANGRALTAQDLNGALAGTSVVIPNGSLSINLYYLVAPDAGSNTIVVTL